MKFAPIGLLEVVPALERLPLVGEPVRTALKGWERGCDVGLVEIDPDLADTATFCERYGVRADESANCVVVSARRQGVTRFGACVVLATTRADVNGVVRRRLDARKVSFAPLDVAVAETDMEHGGITPVGLPAEWPILIDGAVARHPRVVIGSGVRSSKLLLAGTALVELPCAEVLADLAR